MDNNGFEKFVGGLSVNFSVKTVPIKITLDKEVKNGTVELSSADIKTPGSLKGIRCAVWSEANGQDDLKWYDLEYGTLSKKWSKEFPLSIFKSTGKCYIHVYGVRADKSEIFFGGNTFSIPSPSIDVSVATDNAKGTFSINMNNLKAPWGVNNIEAAVWSQDNQNDLKWYQAESDGNGSYVITSDISKHKYNIGVYNIHIYITLSSYLFR